MTATVTGVTIASPPVVNFKLATKQGVPVIGFGSTSKSLDRDGRQLSEPRVLARQADSRFRRHAEQVGQLHRDDGAVRRRPPLAPTRPSTDNTGTLVDNKDGTYTYTFYRDVPGIKAQVDAMTVTAPNNKADLGDLTYDASLTHRLTIQISGNAPGTGTNTANGVQTVTGVPMTNAVDVIYDFIPATGQAPAAARQPQDHHDVELQCLPQRAGRHPWRQPGKQRGSASMAVRATTSSTAWCATPTSASTAGRKRPTTRRT